jgi:hypothetical protein
MRVRTWSQPGKPDPPLYTGRYERPKTDPFRRRLMFALFRHKALLEKQLLALPLPRGVEISTSHEMWQLTADGIAIIEQAHTSLFVAGRLPWFSTPIPKQP